MLDPLRLHTSLVFTIVALLSALALWAIVAALRGAELGQQQRAGLWVAELLLLAECLVGGVLWARGMRPAQPEVHLLYGVVAAATIPALLWWPSEGGARAAQARIAIGCVFLSAIALRALQTGRL
jgi:hypothetical protein